MHCRIAKLAGAVTFLSLALSFAAPLNATQQPPAPPAPAPVTVEVLRARAQERMRTDQAFCWRSFPMPWTTTGAGWWTCWPMLPSGKPGILDQRFRIRD